MTLAEWKETIEKSDIEEDKAELCAIIDYYQDATNEPWHGYDESCECSECKIKKEKKGLCKFQDLALGTRFRYIKTKKVWIRIGANTIAEWDESQKATKWIGQQICCFSDDEDDLKHYVEVL